MTSPQLHEVQLHVTWPVNKQAAFTEFSTWCRREAGKAGLEFRVGYTYGGRMGGGDGPIQPHAALLVITAADPDRMKQFLTGAQRKAGELAIVIVEQTWSDTTGPESSS